jgi:hypothetical protein
VRYHGLTPQASSSRSNYFYQRFAGDDGTNYAPLRGLPDTSSNAGCGRFLDRGVFPAEYIAPYVHTIGLSLNYSDEQFTQSVLRLETIYDIGIPFLRHREAHRHRRAEAPGVTNKEMWKGMIGFDRPTWIRAINKKTTVFLTGQLFWHYLVGNPSCEPQKVARGESHADSCLIGALDLPSLVRNDGNKGTETYRDKIRDWESIFTLAAFTFYRGGSIVPVLGVAVDWVNQWNMEPFWAVDYLIRQDLVVNLSQRYIVTPRGNSTPIFSTWGIGGLNSGRSETNLRITYQF